MRRSHEALGVAGGHRPRGGLQLVVFTANASAALKLVGEAFPDFVSRVSRVPLVNTALRAYVQGKASSRVVKYGAEMVESSVKAVSRPAIDRLPVNSLNEFACRQLDKVPVQQQQQHPPGEWGAQPQRRARAPRAVGRGAADARRVDGARRERDNMRLSLATAW
ncbi:hypothetical protein FA95DRAFT_1638382 [Auriscalpium vulgare]|uniref:Uncharacterized protein n=1 Tax=Auriscalpium vulgare TaxID=40419 RepID=A0ACB8RD66_9AGAM|nr:hypothetical protein FA95DRAFT_1638382 [Auriscalpium vulgare]